VSTTSLPTTDLPTIDLLVSGDPSTPTGGYVYNRQILSGLAELGWRTAVHALDPSFPRPTPSALRAARTLLAGLPDGAVVVIDGLALAGLERALETQRRRLRVVALVHHPLALETGVDPASARLLETAERSALALVRRVICTSQWTARALAAHYRVPIASIRVVEPGVDRRTVATSTHAAEGPLQGGVDGDRLNLLCVGTLTPRKGHALLFEALGELRDRRWHLTCAGSITYDAATAAALDKQLDRLALRSRVSVLGNLDPDTLERYYERADVFVLPSYFEGYGMALAEAVARGIPVVSTTGGAIPETVPAAASILVPPGDGRALCKALAMLLDDEPARRRLAANARAARATLPTWSGAAHKFAAALQGVGDRP
jgi:glycosyltransferase involved in cell wall biosynthesis